MGPCFLLARPSILNREWRAYNLAPDVCVCVTPGMKPVLASAGVSPKESAILSSVCASPALNPVSS